MASAASKWQNALKMATAKATGGKSKANSTVSNDSNASNTGNTGNTGNTSNTGNNDAASPSQGNSDAGTGGRSQQAASGTDSNTTDTTHNNSNNSNNNSGERSVKMKWQNAFKKASSKASGVMAAAAAATATAASAAATSVTSVHTSSVASAASRKESVSDAKRAKASPSTTATATTASAAQQTSAQQSRSQAGTQAQTEQTPKASGNKKRLSSLFLRKRMSVRRSGTGRSSTLNPNSSSGPGGDNAKQSRAQAVMEKILMAKNELQTSVGDAANQMMSSKGNGTGPIGTTTSKERRSKPVSANSLDPSPGFQQFHGKWQTTKSTESSTSASSPSNATTKSSITSPVKQLFGSLSFESKGDTDGAASGTPTKTADGTAAVDTDGESTKPEKKLSNEQMLKMKAKQALVRKKKRDKDEPPSKEGAIWNKLLRTSLRLVTAKRRVMAKRVKLHNVWGKSLEDDEAEFTPPVYPKSKEDCDMIRHVMTQNFVFDNLVPKETEAMVNAFEMIEYQPKTTIVEQGEQGWFFYIVKTGKIELVINGELVGTATNGNSFGELALLYSCPRAASVRVADNHDEPTVLFRVYQMSFRHLLRAQLKQSMTDRMNMLRSVHFFKDLQEADLMQLGAAMLPHVFRKGDDIMKGNATPFCLIQEGEVIARDIKIGEQAVEDVHIGPGQHFGEDSLSKIGTSVKASTMTALSTGVAFTIDRDTFEKVFGDISRLAIKTLHKQRLEEVATIRNSNLTESELDTLSRQVEDKTFGARRVLFTRGSICTPALYLVEKGSVKLIQKDGTEEIVKEGGCFGEDFFSMDTSKPMVKAKFTALTLEQTTCGILTIRECRLVMGEQRMNAIAGATGASIAGSSTEQEHALSIDDFARHRILGTGLFGKVWLVSKKKNDIGILAHAEGDDDQLQESKIDIDIEDRSSSSAIKDDEFYALKVQSTQKSVRPNATKLIRCEIKVMKRLQHPFVIRLLHVFPEPDAISMLMSVAPGGELFDIIHQEDENGNWASGIGEIGKFYAMVIADTLAFMHRRHYVYRDLKPENVLIDSDGYPVITDFGFTKKVTDKTYTFCGTPNYLPPEIILNRGHDVTADNWCLGVLIYELIEGENPFFESGMNQMTLYETICKEPHYPLPEDSVSEDARDLVNRLLEKDPNMRLGTFREKDILEHTWFAEYDLKKLRTKEIESPWAPDAIEP